MPTASSASLLVVATPAAGAALSSLKSDLPAGQTVLDAWVFSTDGFTTGDPAYLSLLVGVGYTPAQLAAAAFSRTNLSVWDYNGASWSLFQADDLTFDGTYASFTTTAINDLTSSEYAIAGTPLMPGDANRDGRVDINDLTIVLSNFGKTGVTWSQGDFTGDGTVDINDLTIVLSNFGKTAALSAAGMAAVPEPGAIALLLAGAIGLLACAWRRRA
jgi:hypothetical protein